MAADQIHLQLVEQVRLDRHFAQDPETGVDAVNALAAFGGFVDPGAAFDQPLARFGGQRDFIAALDDRAKAIERQRIAVQRMHCTHG